MADAKVNTKALEVSAATTSSARNIPPHYLSATIPKEAYPLGKIIFKGEWRYLLDIAEILQQRKNITPESYPVFVCNRIHKIDKVKVAAFFHIGTTKAHPPIPDHLSAEAKDFLLKCLEGTTKAHPPIFNYS